MVSLCVKHMCMTTSSHAFNWYVLSIQVCKKHAHGLLLVSHLCADWSLINSTYLTSKWFASVVKWLINTSSKWFLNRILFFWSVVEFTVISQSSAVSSESVYNKRDFSLSFSRGSKLANSWPYLFKLNTTC